MERFYFNTSEGGKARDGSSAELADFAEAKHVATTFAGDLLKDLDGSIFDNELSLEVTGPTGLVLLSISISGQLSPAAGRSYASS